MQFTFAVTPPAMTDTRTWTDALRRIEDGGFHSAVFADHFTEGWDAEPMVALTAAAMATTTLRLQTGVLSNDYRHPVLTHRLAATADRISDGRFVLGIGAGWLRSDYEQAGIPFDAPGVRISRLEEALSIIKRLFSDAPVDHEGTYYRIDGLVGIPSAVQQPHPPIMLGGGSPRVLRFAGREADVVSIVASLRAGALGSHAVEDLMADRVEEKLGWVREGIVSAGRDPAAVVLSINHWLVRVTDSEEDANAYLRKVAASHSVDPTRLADSPAVLVGTVPKLVDVIHERRERFGFSHLQLDAGFPPRDIESLMPLVGELAGV